MSKPQFVPPREGSRKRRVFDAWTKQPDAAFTLGKKLRLKEGTLHSWFGHWRRMCVIKVTKAKAKPAKAPPSLYRKKLREKAKAQSVQLEGVA